MGASGSRRAGSELAPNVAFEKKAAVPPIHHDVRVPGGVNRRGMAALAFLITNLFGGGGQTAVLVWIGGLSLSFALPVLAVGLAVRAFRGIAVPLADVMTAADHVAEGNLSARVPEGRRGGFNRLANSFNRMVEELERTDKLRRKPHRRYST